MSTFKSDTRGFLIGELLDTHRDLLGASRQEQAIWRSIEADVAAIARALGARPESTDSQTSRGQAVQHGAATVTPAGRGVAPRGAAKPFAQRAQQLAAAGVATSRRAPTVTARPRDVRERFVAAASASLPLLDPASPRQVVSQPAGAAAHSATRAANGRFVAGRSRDGANATGEGGGVDGRMDDRGRGLVRPIVAGLLDAAGGGASGVDPTLQAAAEIKDVVAPLGRGMFSAMGERRKESRRERWYARLLKALTRRGTAQDGPVTAGLGAGGADSGGLLGMMSGGLMRFLPAIAAAVLPALAGLATGALATWVGGKIYGWLDKSGILTKVFDVFDNVRSFVDDAKTKVSTWAADAWSSLRDSYRGTPALDASGRRIDDPRRVDSSAKSLPQRVGEALGTGARAVRDALARPAQTLAQAVGAAGATVSSGVRRVVAAGRGFTEVEEVDGSVSRRTGARNWRNNNPGNLEFNDYTRSLGAVGSDGRFAVFSTLAAGRQAQGKMLFEGAKYKGLDLKAAIARYAPEKENNTARYQQTVLAAVGGVNRTMADYSPAERTAILDAMARVEGFKAGTVASVTAPTSVVATPRLGMASAPKLNLPTTPKLPAVPQDAAPMAAPLATRKDSTVVIIQEPVGQNVRDRNIAHAVTGGLGG